MWLDSSIFILSRILSVDHFRRCWNFLLQSLFSVLERCFHHPFHQYMPIHFWSRMICQIRIPSKEGGFTVGLFTEIAFTNGNWMTLWLEYHSAAGKDCTHNLDCLPAECKQRTLFTCLPLQRPTAISPSPYLSFTFTYNLWIYNILKVSLV